MSTEEALITVCDKIIAVPGNPKMKHWVRTIGMDTQIKDTERFGQT